MTRFKLALTFVTDEDYPYLFQVAVPVGKDQFVSHDFKFGSFTNAMMLFAQYSEEYKKRHDSIMEFHQKKVVEFQSNLELPFRKV